MINVNVRIILVLLAIAVFSSCEKEYNFDWTSGTYSTSVNGTFLILSDTGFTHSGRLWVSDTGLNNTALLDYFPTYVSKEGDRIFFSFEYEKLALPTIEVEITSIYDGTHEESVRFQVVNNDKYVCTAPYHLSSTHIRRDKYSGHKIFHIYIQETNSDSDTLYRWSFVGSGDP